MPHLPGEPKYFKSQMSPKSKALDNAKKGAGHAKHGAEHEHFYRHASMKDKGETCIHCGKAK